MLVRRKSKGWKQSKRDLRKTKPQDGIFLESRKAFKGPIIHAGNYNEFKVEREIPGDVSFEEALEIRKEQKKESNKIRSLSKKYLKAYLRGKSQIRFGEKEVDGKKQPNILNITSNEYSFYKKV